MPKQRVPGSWSKKIVNSDLQEERDKCDFDMSLETNGLEQCLDETHTQRYRDAIEFMESDPLLKNDHRFYQMSRKEAWDYQIKKLRRAYELGKQKWFVEHECNMIHWGYVGLGQSPCVLNYTMFQLTIQNMCTDEQKAKWIPLTKNMRIMGTYAQTEIGHGSDVSQLQTTATFDPKTDEFIINTPSDTATKWWPGDLGMFSSHAMVFARLIIEDNDYGVMPFIVQIRSLETWKPLNGVTCGDMGPKMGYNSKNNGWCTFNQVRTPRENMPMKYVSVDKEGTFSIEGDLRALYSVMMDIRVQLVQHSGMMLLKSVIISLRYSACRRQFRMVQANGKKDETKLIDYQTQQLKLFPLLSQAVAFMMSHAFVLKKYDDLLAGVKKGDFALLDEMHHFTSGMKSVFSQYCMDGLLISRQSVGGAGYSAWSSLPYLIDDFSPVTTFEGDNTVMAQQSGRFLQKLHKRAKKGEKLIEYFSYLNEIEQTLHLKCKAKTGEDFCNISQVDEAFKHCTTYLTETTIQSVGESKLSKQQKTNFVFAIDTVKMAQLHIKYVAFQIFRQKIETTVKCPKLKGHMLNLCILLGLTFLQECKSYGYDSGYFQKGAQVLLDDATKIILEKLRPQIISILDVFQIKDNVLMSAIGNSYGDIYETHLEWAKTSHLNTPENGNIAEGWIENIMPIIQGKL